MARKANKADRPRVGLIYSVRPDNEYFLPQLYVVHIKPDGKVRNFSSSFGICSGAGTGFPHLADLVIDAQGQNDEREKGVYGERVRYSNVYSIDAVTAEAMAKTLKKIHAGLTRLYNVRGSTPSFGSFAGRVAEVLGADTILFRVQDSRSGWSYDDSEFLYLSVGEGVSRINWLTKKWQAGEKVEYA